ncbi:MAG: glycerol-3-phosphate dehydrogenase/oxidase [Bdellovibrionota bacterium]
MANDFPNYSLNERSKSWNDIDKTVFDLLIIGGGITGAGIARDAASRGLKTLLVERKDFAWGTSSRSSKLVHGGVRYLEQFEFKLVKESTQERAKLWKLAPQLVSPLAFLFPAYKSSRVPLWQLNIGLWMYDTLAKFKVPELHRKYSAKALKELEPELNQDGLSGAIHYFDGATDDARLTLANILDAHTLGATTLSRVECCAVEWNKKVPESAVASHSVELEDKLSGEKKKVQARVVVSAAGPWTDELLEKIGKAKRKLLRPTRGSHIVVKQEKLPLRHAVVMTHPVDGRVLFAIPWGDFSVLGTTDLDDSNSPDQTQITTEEVEYLINSAKYYFPKCHIVKDDVTSTWTGLRPLIAPPENVSASSVSREHFLDFADPGLLLIAGGKLTTYRQMAEDCVDKVIEDTQSWTLPVGNVAGATQTNERAITRLYEPTAKNGYLGTSEAGRLNNEDVEKILATQMVLTLEDFMVRRTSIYYKEEQNGWKLVPKLKSSFQKVLAWDDAKWESEVQDYKKYLEHNMSFALGRSYQ